MNQNILMKKFKNEFEFSKRKKLWSFEKNKKTFQTSKKIFIKIITFNELWGELSVHRAIIKKIELLKC